MNFKYIIGLFFICFSCQLSAQNPGFLGKKLSVFYDYVVTPGFGRAIPYNASEQSKPNKKSIRNFVRYRHEIDLEYAITRKWGVGVDYFYHRGGYGPVDEDISNQTNYYNQYFSRNIKRHGFGIFARKYRVNLSGYNSDEGGMAPLGYYWEPKIFMSMDKYQIKANSDYFDGHDVIFASKSFTRLGASFKMGRHLLLFDRVLVDFGLEFGYVFPVDFDKMSDLSVIDVALLESTIHPYEQILAHHLFGFHIGIGYVLF